MHESRDSPGPVESISTSGKESSQPGSERNFLREWPRFLRGPRAFLESCELSTSQTAKRATKFLLFGLTGGIAFSSVNLKFSAYANSAATKKLFEGEVLVFTLLLNCILIAVLFHWIARMFQGHGTFLRTYSSMSFIYAFGWPATAFVLIGLGWVIRISTDLDYFALPPFDTTLGGSIERTTKNILIVALVATFYLWMIGYWFYWYTSAVSVAHVLKVGRCIWVVILGVGITMMFETPVAKLSHSIAEILEPILKWALKLYGE